MLNIRTLILSIALVVIVGLVTARTAIFSDPSRDLSSVLNNQEQSANQNKAPVASYRSPLDECFDVPLSEAAACHTDNQTPIQSYRSPIDECFDVSLRELANCRNASQALAP